MMRNENFMKKGIDSIFNRLSTFSGFLSGSEDLEYNDVPMIPGAYDGKANKECQFAIPVLDDFRKNVGKLRAETGGMLASKKDEKNIDVCHFDVHSQNTSGTFYYDVESMSEVFREWKAKGYITNGIYHSHPVGAIYPSYHDISTALLHIDFFGIDYFYLPIFQPERRGFYKLYFYVVRKEDNILRVTLDYVIKATEFGYDYISFNTYDKTFSIDELRAYRERIDGSAKKAASIPTSKYFEKVASLYTDHARDKVIVCIGTGGARSFLENMARCGFRNYILIEADVVSPSNVATQGVFVSEMGKKKTEVLRNRILDINPDAAVVCVDRFLDNEMTDEEFKSYLDRFPNRESTDYLILGCTDSFAAQERSATLALKYGMPYLAAMMYAGGVAAEIIYIYPGVTESCPRCLLRDRYERYENGFVNDVGSEGCSIFATERMNATKGFIAQMLLMYGEKSDSPLATMLEGVKNRNFVEIRLNPFLRDTALGIDLFDRAFADASRYVYFDETIWIPQHPDRPEFGAETCKLCGGTGNLKSLKKKWRRVDTRDLCVSNKKAVSPAEQMLMALAFHTSDNTVDFPNTDNSF